MHAHVSAILVLLSIHTFPSLTSFPTSIAPVLCTFVTTAALSHARHKTVSTIANSIVVYPRVDYCSSLFPNFESRAYFKQDLQLHKAWRSANGQYNNCSRVHLRLNPKKIDTKGFSTESVTICHAF